jgi:hypothetical protein
MSNGDWTRDEVEATVADYFVMLGAELRGENYSKAEHNRQLQQVIGRSKGSAARWLLAAAELPDATRAGGAGMAGG